MSTMIKRKQNAAWGTGAGEEQGVRESQVAEVIVNLSAEGQGAHSREWGNIRQIHSKQKNGNGGIQTVLYMKNHRALTRNLMCVYYSQPS